MISERNSDSEDFRCSIERSMDEAISRNRFDFVCFFLNDMQHVTAKYDFEKTVCFMVSFIL